MASKRKGKEIEGSGNGVGRKRTAVRNHGISFKDDEQRDRFKSLISRPITACRYPDVNTMDKLGIKNYVHRLLGNLGLIEMLKPMWGFENFTYQFLSSLSFTKDKLKTDNPNQRVSFRLLNVDYECFYKLFVQN